MVVELSATDVKIVSGLDTTPGTEEHNRSKTRVIINLQIYLTVQFPRIIFVKIGCIVHSLHVNFFRCSCCAQSSDLGPSLNMLPGVSRL